VELRDYAHVVVLTGAGISHSAGLATYRGPGGLWSDPKVAALAHADAIRDERRAAACAMFWRFRRAVADAKPTAAHRALAAFEAARPAGTSFLLVTQNIDGLHQAAGSQNVCEFHGSLARWRCECGHIETPPRDATDGPEHCGAPMRPDCVLFGEDIPAAADHLVRGALRDCDLFVSIGTSGTVSPAANFVRSAAYSGARTLLLNLEVGDDAREMFREAEAGPADELVPRWFAT
jgi:NAD-dependent deacetylase